MDGAVSTNRWIGNSIFLLTTPSVLGSLRLFCLRQVMLRIIIRFAHGIASQYSACGRVELSSIIRYAHGVLSWMNCEYSYLVAFGYSAFGRYCFAIFWLKPGDASHHYSLRSFAAKLLLVGWREYQLAAELLYVLCAVTAKLSCVPVCRNLRFLVYVYTC